MQGYEHNTYALQLHCTARRKFQKSRENALSIEERKITVPLIDLYLNIVWVVKIAHLHC